MVIVSLKNIAVTEDGTVKIVDVEHSTSFLGAVTRELPGARLRLARAMSADFSSLSHSLDEFLFAPSISEKLYTDPEKFEETYKNIYMPYRQMIQESTSPHTQMLLEAYDRMLDQKRSML